MGNAQHQGYPQSRPAWQPDSDAPACNKCLTLFTFITRRHHCRLCGRVFCATCSAHFLRLDRLGYTSRQRTCDMCFTQLVRHKDKTDALNGAELNNRSGQPPATARRPVTMNPTEARYRSHTASTSTGRQGLHAQASSLHVQAHRASLGGPAGGQVKSWTGSSTFSTAPSMSLPDQLPAFGKSPTLSTLCKSPAAERVSLTTPLAASLGASVPRTGAPLTVTPPVGGIGSGVFSSSPVPSPIPMSCSAFQPSSSLRERGESSILGLRQLGGESVPNSPRFLSPPQPSPRVPIATSAVSAATSSAASSSAASSSTHSVILTNVQPQVGSVQTNSDRPSTAASSPPNDSAIFSEELNRPRSTDELDTIYDDFLSRDHSARTKKYMADIFSQFGPVPKQLQSVHG